jgi:mono/diheme cytochrome c family protein
MVLQIAKRMLPMVLLWSLTPASAETAPDVDGATLFERHCTICHGVYGQGDGPMAPDLEVRLQDLRDLAARNDGSFPETWVRRIVDGREMRAAHGPAGKPVWGDVLGAGAVTAEESDTLARSRLDAIVGFLRSLQRDPS